jgi:hypothetical protein
MTLSLEFLATLIGILSVVGPGAFYLGRLTNRVDAVERSHVAMLEKLEKLADAIQAAVLAGGVLHCPLAEDERCFFNHQKKRDEA